MSEPSLHSEIVVPQHRLSNIIAWACALTLITMGLGTTYALNQNWQVRLDTSKIQLIRGAEMVNMLLEHALVDATKALSTTKNKNAPGGAFSKDSWRKRSLLDIR